MSRRKSKEINAAQNVEIYVILVACMHHEKV